MNISDLVCIIGLIVSMLSTCRSFDAKYCYESSSTVKNVTRCPESQLEWSKRQEIKNCAALTQNCSGNLVYHCLINPWQSETIEVCAPSAVIEAGYCAEYNTRGRRIQDFYEPTCSSCKTKYWSTDAYRYQECYYPVYKKRSDENKANRAAATESNTIHLFSSSVFICVYSSARRLI